jgi:hypothetical protein
VTAALHWRGGFEFKTRVSGVKSLTAEGATFGVEHLARRRILHYLQEPEPLIGLLTGHDRMHIPRFTSHVLSFTILRKVLAAGLFSTPLALLACILMPSTSMAESAVCRHVTSPWQAVLSPNELKAVLDDKPGTDIVLQEAGAIQKVSRLNPPSQAAKKRIIPATWEQTCDAVDSEALLSMALGRWDEALRQVNTALAQDPLDPPSLFILTEIQMRRGHLPEAEAAMRRALEIRPTMGGGHYVLGLVLLARGDRDAALLEMQEETTDFAQQAGLGFVYYALGRKTDSDAALARMLKEQADGNAFEIAEVYAFRGSQMRRCIGSNAPMRKRTPACTSSKWSSRRKVSQRTLASRRS